MNSTQQTVARLDCPSGPGFTNGMFIAGYAPGSSNRAFPNNATLSLPPETRFVMQLHITSRTIPPRQLVDALWEVDEPSGISPRGLTLVDQDFYIPAGAESHTVQSTSYIVTEEELAAVPDFRYAGLRDRGQIWGAAHMHTRGKSVRIDLLRADGTEECLLDIPEWDFNWQGSYRFKEPVQTSAGDEVRITCTWDNSAGNQPIIDGQPLEPAISLGRQHL